MTIDLERTAPAAPAVADPVVRRRRPWSLRRTIASLGVHGILVVLALLSLIPLYWAVATSFLPASQINGGAQTLLPLAPTVENYLALFSETRFTTVMWNSAVVSIVVTAFGTIFAAAAGYAFGKLYFRGRNLLFLVLLLTLMIPTLVIVPVNFILMSNLGLLNTLWSVILPQLTPAFGIFWMRQYSINAIPDQVLEAAEIDGAGTIRTFWQVGLPMMRPGIAGLAIFLFMSSWNQLLLPLTYLQSNEMQTYPVFLSNLNSSYATPQTNLALVTAVLSTIPLLIIFIFGQRYFVAGATSGAVKG